MTYKLVETLLKENKSVTFFARGQSMEPTLLDGTEIRVSKKPFRLYDIVFVKRKNHYILHRIIDIHDDIITLQGDALNRVEHINKCDILGVYEDGFYDAITAYLNGDVPSYVDHKRYRKHELLFNKPKPTKITYHDAKVIHIIKVFEKATINYVVLKGYAIDHMYVNPYHRSKGDLDLYIFQKDMKKAGECLKSFGFEKKSDHPLHDIFHLDGFHVELHHALDEVYPINVLKSDVTWISFRNKIKIPILKEDKQYLHLLIHAKKHMLNGGIGIKHLLDFYYMKETYKESPFVHTFIKTHQLDTFHHYIIACIKVLKREKIDHITHLKYVWIMLNEIKHHGVHTTLNKRLQVKKTQTIKNVFNVSFLKKNILKRIKNQGLFVFLKKSWLYVFAKKDTNHMRLIKELFYD